MRSRRTHSLRLERCERCPGRIDIERKRPKVAAKLLVAAAAWLASTFLLRQRTSSTLTSVMNDCSLQIQPIVTFPQARRASHTVDIITEIQNLLSNSKVRKVIHSGRITFRVLTNYIPRFGELHSAVMANYIPHFPVGPRPRPAVSA